jgi:hypothetical protein
MIDITLAECEHPKKIGYASGRLGMHTMKEVMYIRAN